MGGAAMLDDTCDQGGAVTSHTIWHVEEGLGVDDVRDFVPGPTPPQGLASASTKVCPSHASYRSAVHRRSVTSMRNVSRLVSVHITSRAS